MLPAMAIQTLNKLGFKEYRTYDNVAKRKLNKVQTVEDWAKKLMDIVDEPDVALTIMNNNTLMYYLRLLVEKVNTNPSILNSTYTGDTDESVPYNPDRFSYTNFAKLGLKARYTINKKICHSDIDRLEHQIYRDNILFGNRIGNLVLNNSLSILVGGGNNNDDAFNDINISEKYTSIIFKKLYANYTDVLRSSNKSLSKKDNQKIIFMIDDLAKKENKLFQVVDLINKYNEIVDVFGNIDGKSSLDLDYMNNAVNTRHKLFNKRMKRQNSLISVLRSIVEKVNISNEKLHMKPVGENTTV